MITTLSLLLLGLLLTKREQEKRDMRLKAYWANALGIEEDRMVIVRK